nr:GNAT family N-acetyltransferase [Xanthomonas campestris]
MGWHARCAGAAGGRLIALDQDAAYANAISPGWPNVLHASCKSTRIVVAAHAQRRGLATRLHNDLIRTAHAAAQPRVVCEVHRVPPNPASLAFHRQLGFAPIGEASLAGGKHVVYLEKRL